MSQSLTPSAVRLCGLVCRQLGWRPGDFWATTPAEIAAIFAGDPSADTAPLTRSDLHTLMEQDSDG